MISLEAVPIHFQVDEYTFYKGGHSSPEMFAFLSTGERGGGVVPTFKKFFPIESGFSFLKRYKFLRKQIHSARVVPLFKMGGKNIESVPLIVGNICYLYGGNGIMLQLILDL